ncbi:hypothetical protein LX99_00181 [Mucilaginibacter oryzae]|uniref:NACHT domain-containing protein n=1 Tax=Mucilaginibacter oryzae TaxID=468058 RepID=A0A316HI43_9SPHI|nr:hypothetical protein [Mucilaginibacter oryzae]PWK79721.1 hypothetical protein LX99_00181 [Mucilaginibacter oryzae]
MVDTLEIKVFVSCPGDVTPEKDTIKAICENLNNFNMNNKRKVRFRVLDFRDIVADMDGRPQEQINLIFSDYDIYIGMLWMRFGTPSGAEDPATGKAYLSGTEEEFRLAYQRKQAGENINVYLLFKEPSAIKGGASETRQLLQVQEFFEEVCNLGWVMKFPITPTHDFYNKVSTILMNRAEQIDQQELINEKNAFLSTPASETIPAVLRNPAEFITKAPKIDTTIPRVLLSFEGQKDPLTAYIERTGDLELIKLVKEKNFVVLLGNAGSGKSTELAKLANFYASEETPFIPVYSRMNTYVEEDIRDFLPTGWTDIPENTALIILDGLDEVRPKHFNTAVRKILSFKEDFPNVHIVVSCRTNFYHLPDKHSGGTLADFSIYFLAQVGDAQTKEFAEEQYQLDYQKFRNEAYDRGFQEFTGQPFFLRILLEQFKKRGNLSLNRVDLLNILLDERITLDQQHFELTTNLKDHKEHILQLLQKIALCMEYLGRNFLSFDELLKVLPNPEDLQLIKFSTAFRSMEDGTNNWGFEHNNIQEFLAAKALLAFHLERIKAFLSFKNERIKPSWLNTLFFLISLLPDAKRNDLIDWILIVEPEVLVRVEPDKVNSATRFEIFKTIFNHYKAQRVWLRSNKFSDRELASFGESEDAVDFLIAELNNSENARTTRFNAMNMLKYFKLSGDYLNKTKNAIWQHIIENTGDYYIVHSGIYALDSLGVINAEMIAELMELFGNRSNQYIRSALYRVIIEAGMIDDYVDYFISGFVDELDPADRGEVSLMDEDMLLRQGLTNIKEPANIKKLLELFENPYDRRIINFFEKNKVLENLIERATSIFKTHPELSEDVYRTYVAYGRHSEEFTAQAIAVYFQKTGQTNAVFQRIFNDKKIEDYEKGLLLRHLVNQENIDYVVNQYKTHNATNEELLKFYNNLRWNIYKTDKSVELHYLTKILTEETQVLTNFNDIDYAKIRLENEQKSFELYFSIEAFTNELVQFFQANEIADLDWDTLWQFQYNRNDRNYHVPEAIHELLIEFTRNKQSIDLASVLKFVNDEERFANYRFSKIKDKISNRPDVLVSEEQIQIITAWVQNVILNTDIVNAIKVENSNRTTYSKLVMVLWAFIKIYKIPVLTEKLLDFTLFDEVKNNDNQGLEFSVIENQVGKDAVQVRVHDNLIAGIEYDQSWRNNAIYALENNIPNTIGSIINSLFDHRKSEYSRRPVLKTFLQQGGNPELLLVGLKMTHNSDMLWEIVREIKDYPAIDADLRKFLTEKLVNEHVQPTEKFLAATYLTEKGDKEGTSFYLNYLLETARPNFDFYHQSQIMRQIKDIEFLPILLQLLEKANQEEFMQDDFNRFDSIVSDSLYNLGLISEENLSKVKTALEDFIKKNDGQIKNVNFLHPMIERMEFNFYLAQSQSNDIQDALSEVAKLYQ